PWCPRLRGHQPCGSPLDAEKETFPLFLCPSCPVLGWTPASDVVSLRTRSVSEGGPRSRFGFVAEGSETASEAGTTNPHPKRDGIRWLPEPPLLRSLNRVPRLLEDPWTLMLHPAGVDRLPTAERANESSLSAAVSDGNK